MQYHNRDFGEAVEAITDSHYNDTKSDGGSTPPPLAFILIDDSGEGLRDDSGNDLITP